MSLEPPPLHYISTDGLQPWDVISQFELDYWAGNVVKYMLRAGKKNGESTLKDLKKARNYIDYMIAREEHDAA